MLLLTQSLPLMKARFLDHLSIEISNGSFMKNNCYNDGGLEKATSIYWESKIAYFFLYVKNEITQL